jgi:hypothetical protein
MTKKNSFTTIYLVLSVAEKNKLKTLSTHETKEEAFKEFNLLCEDNPKENFKVVKTQLIEETIAESNDFRQAKFDFA